MNKLAEFEIDDEVRRIFGELTEYLKKQMSAKGVPLELVHVAVAAIPVDEKLGHSELALSGVLGTFGSDPVILMGCAELMRDSAYQCGYRERPPSQEELSEMFEQILGVAPKKEHKDVH